MPPRPRLPSLQRFASTVSAGPSRAAAAPAAAAIPAGRVFTERKAFLYSHYKQLLSRSQLVLLFTHANLSVANTQAMRRAIASVPLPALATPEEPVQEPATLTIARTGLLGPVVRDVQPADINIASHLTGQAALITCSSLSPKYLKSVITALERTLKKAQKDDKDAKQPTFTLVAGFLEGNRLVTPAEVTATSKLPELGQLRGQLVGLLEQPGRSLLGLLTQAGGGSLVRTLQGLESDLKAKESPAP